MRQKNVKVVAVVDKVAGSDTRVLDRAACLPEARNSTMDMRDDSLAYVMLLRERSSECLDRHRSRT